MSVLLSEAAGSSQIEDRYAALEKQVGKYKVPMGSSTASLRAVLAAGWAVRAVHMAGAGKEKDGAWQDKSQASWALRAHPVVPAQAECWASQGKRGHSAVLEQAEC